jgi:hypothetical protein
MGSLSGLPSPRKNNRLSLFVRLWEHGRDEPVWIGEVQDVASGETVHVQSLEALFDWLRQRTGTPMQPAEGFSPNAPEVNSAESDHE